MPTLPALIGTNAGTDDETAQARLERLERAVRAYRTACECEARCGVPLELERREAVRRHAYDRMVALLPKE